MSITQATEEATADAQSAKPSRRRWLPSDLGPWSPVIAFILLIAFFGIMKPTVFFASGNIFSILNDQAVLAILACGLTVVLLNGEFDLSFGSVLSITGALSAGLITKQGLPTVAAVALVIVAGAFVGLINGVLVTQFRVPALIATLAVGSVLDGLVLWYTGGETIYAGIPQDYLDIGRWSIGQAQGPIFYMIVVAVMLWAMLKYTPPGRYMHAIGGNREAARLSGIRVHRYIILAFVIMGVFAAVAGVVQTARNGSAQPAAGASFLLPAFAAAFLGSATLRRGEFHIPGTIIGVYLIATGSTGFFILGAPFFVAQIFAGAVLILATAGSRLLTRSKQPA